MSDQVRDIIKIRRAHASRRNDSRHASNAPEFWHSLPLAATWIPDPWAESTPRAVAQLVAGRERAAPATPPFRFLFADDSKRTISTVSDGRTDVL